MSAISPFIVSFRVADQNGLITVEFKTFLDQLFARAGGVTGGSYGKLDDGPIINWDVGQKPGAVVVLGGNRTIASPVGMVAGPLSFYRLTIVQDAAGGRTVTWGGAFKFPGGIAPVLSTAPNAVDELVFDCDGTNMKLIGGGKDFR